MRTTERATRRTMVPSRHAFELFWAQAKVQSPGHWPSCPRVAALSSLAEHRQALLTPNSQYRNPNPIFGYCGGPSGYYRETCNPSTAPLEAQRDNKTPQLQPATSHWSTAPLDAEHHPHHGCHCVDAVGGSRVPPGEPCFFGRTILPEMPQDWLAVEKSSLNHHCNEDVSLHRDYSELVECGLGVLEGLSHEQYAGALH